MVNCCNAGLTVAQFIAANNLLSGDRLHVFAQWEEGTLFGVTF